MGVSCAVKATTSVGIRDILPEEVANLVGDSASALEFVNGDAASLGEVTESLAASQAFQC